MKRPLTALDLLREAVGFASEAEGECPSCGAPMGVSPAEAACWIHRAEELLVKADPAYQRRHP